MRIIAECFDCGREFVAEISRISSGRLRISKESAELHASVCVQAKQFFDTRYPVDNYENCMSVEFEFEEGNSLPLKDWLTLKAYPNYYQKISMQNNDNALTDYYKGIFLDFPEYIMDNLPFKITF